MLFEQETYPMCPIYHTLTSVAVTANTLYFRTFIIFRIIYITASAEYPATIVPVSTCAHTFKERDMCRNKSTQVAGYSAVGTRAYFYKSAIHYSFV